MWRRSEPPRESRRLHLEALGLDVHTPLCPAFQVASRTKFKLPATFKIRNSFIPCVGTLCGESKSYRGEIPTLDWFSVCLSRNPMHRVASPNGLPVSDANITVLFTTHLHLTCSHHRRPLGGSWKPKPSRQAESVGKGSLSNPSSWP